MNRKQFAVSFLVALALSATVSAHADVSAQSTQGTPSGGTKLNGVALNGLRFNGPGLVVQGRTFNGPGLVLQGRNFNGPGLVLQGRAFNGPGLVLQGRTFNGPGLVLQGRMFTGFRLNGSGLVGFDSVGEEPALVSSEACTAPKPAREWPLSALQTSSVKVRLASR